VKKLIIIIDYHYCYQSLIHKQEHNYAHCNSFSEFVNNTTKVGLFRLSRSVHIILMETERQIQIEIFELAKLLIKRLDLKILNKVRRALDNTIFPNLLCDDRLLEMPHKIKLIISSK